MLPVRLGMLETLRSERRLKADHAEGKLPLKPLYAVYNVLRFVSLFRLSKDPDSLGQLLMYRDVSCVRLEKDWGIVPDNELLPAHVKFFMFVILPTTSSPPVRFGIVAMPRVVRLVRADHV